MKIKLDKNKRIIKCYKELDVTLIEILEEDNIPEEKYLSPDLNYKNDGFSFYQDSQIYTAGYPDVIIYKRERHMSSGIINKINENDFEHTCDTRKGSSGSPIINVNKQVIGIHYGGDKQNKINYAYFIGVIIDKLEKEKEIQKHKDKNDLNENKENHSKNNENKDLKDLFVNNRPLLQNVMSNPNLVKKCIMMAKNPNMRDIMEEMPMFKNIIKNDPDFFSKIQDPNLVVDIPNKEDFNAFLNKLEDETD